ncbi:ABC transporter permease [Lautropia mirabilis ATCC 51599]|jgi:ABC transporter, permease protein|uniref:ABC transporter, permease protein n=1 Tax=Lautropia mirabilis ATCC 51599 TaxID=887898 RepID=E7S0U3_9BURK|nr:ABC transporter permease [Lautropia mirabilis]EFV93758.1 ABC transporter, permease protein [Lautropia mirabilis ATCC 51599]VEG98957.1 Dipeptide transport system permease protein dppB [Lautropia mirabilis]
MLARLLGRLGQSVLVLLVVSMVSFLVFRYIGDPTVSLLGEDASVAEREALLHELGFDQSVPVQYAGYLKQVLSGHFGISYRFRQPVTEVIASRVPATVELSLAAALFAVVGGIGLGVYTAMRRQSLVSRTIMGVSLVGVSLPTFLIGIGLIYLFSVELKWLPAFGRGTLVDVGGWQTGLLTVSGLSALVLPAITLGFFKLTLIMRLVRTEMLDVLRSDYIRFARARGLRNATLYGRHALRNTLIPVITIIGLQLGSLIAFAIVTETVFQWPGLGLLFITSIQGVDVPVIAAYLLMIGLLYVGINLVVDLLYAWADPRLRRR